MAPDSGGGEQQQADEHRDEHGRGHDVDQQAARCRAGHRPQRHGEDEATLLAQNGEGGVAPVAGEGGSIHRGGTAVARGAPRAAVGGAENDALTDAELEEADALLDEADQLARWLTDAP